MAVQLDFFCEKTESQILQEEIEALKKSQDKLRKALFARHGELAKKYLEINDRLEILEMNICRGKI
jgi:hypothetical protein